MEKKGVITFVDYKVTKIVFENNEDYEGEEVDIEFNIETNVQVSEDGEEMVVIMKTNIFEPEDGKVYPFSMSVEIEGYFKSNIEDKEQEITQYATNAVAILFPYVRALVSTYTANANVTPLILPTVNVNRLMEKEKNS